MFAVSALAAGCTVTSINPDAGTGLADAGGSNEDAASSVDAGGASDTGAPDASVGTDGSTSGGCTFGEPNDTRETATPIELNQAYTGLCISNADNTADPSDFYVVTAPNDAAGGYVTFTISNVSASADATGVATAVADNAEMVTANGSSGGATVTGWFTVSPGAKYRLEVKQYVGGAAFTYDLQLAYTKITDAYEPNNTRDVAKTIAVGTPIQASAAAPAVNGVLGTTDPDDWYSVTLAAGSATVTVSNVPSDYGCAAHLFDSSNAAAGNATTPGAGANCEFVATNLTGGVYTLQVGPYIGTERAGVGAPLPSVTGSYTLSVTQ